MKRSDWLNSESRDFGSQSDCFILPLRRFIGDKFSIELTKVGAKDVDLMNI